MKTFKIYADAAELRVQVFPTTHALGDAFWGAHLYSLGDGLLLNDEPIIVGAGWAQDAAEKVARDWMASQGLPTTIYKITQV